MTERTRKKRKYQYVRREYKGLDGTENYAVYSKCEKYRYFLARYWDMTKPVLVMIMLNPSTATERQNDPTVQRCETRARTNDYGGLVIINIFAYRATDPKNMRAAGDPVGPYNNKFIKQYLDLSAIHDAGKYDIICGWGTHGTFKDRAADVFKMFASHGIAPRAFRWTKGGHPQHPLYLSYKEEPKAKP